MNSKRLDKNLLIELLAGNPDKRFTSDILDSEEVKALMSRQWDNPEEVVSTDKPDFNCIFYGIKEKISGNNDINSHSKTISISEFEELKRKNTVLRRRIILITSIAAAILLCIIAGSISFINTSKIFQKSFTQNIAPKGQKSQVIMPDGTMAFLNSGTILKYDNSFGKRNRNVELVGEAYFEVSHNKKLPFVIRANEVEIEVVGTKFNVMAYPDEAYIETTVTEGKVNIREISGTSSLFLTANQKASYNKTSKLLVLNDEKANSSISWKDNVLSFDNENFNDVIKKLERWYDISIIVEGKDSLEDRFTLTIRHESLREVLDLISLTTQFEYAINDNQVKITYK
jgi:transmembrane sensor